MNDEEVTQYMESRGRRFEPADLKLYIRECNEHPRTLLLGLFDKENGIHIGNLKLAPIEERYRRGDVGIVIGDKARWGRGLACEAIIGLTAYAFSALGLFKLTAACYASNHGSYRAFLAAGWHEEGRRQRHYRYQGHWEDAVLLARFCDDV